MNPNKWKVCPHCGYVGAGRMKGSFLIELVLFLCFIIPWLIYFLWRTTQHRSVCPKCGCKDMLPINSPQGRILYKQFAADREYIGE